MEEQEEGWGMNGKMGERHQDEGKMEKNADGRFAVDEWIYGQVGRWKDGCTRMMDRWMDLGCRVNMLKTCQEPSVASFWPGLFGTDHAIPSPGSGHCWQDRGRKVLPGWGPAAARGGG